MPAPQKIEYFLMSPSLVHYLLLNKKAPDRLSRAIELANLNSVNR
ncbi:MAG: hypothetical protein ACKO2V_11140 [Snowella sp.]